MFSISSQGSGQYLLPPCLTREPAKVVKKCRAQEKPDTERTPLAQTALDSLIPKF